MKKLDMGCGPNKQDEYFGADIIPYDGVDYVFDFDAVVDWPIENNTFDYIKAHHIIEHVHDITHFFCELHRISKHDAIIHLETPHYSSHNSWKDPTHINHFSLFFTDAITEGYLSKRIPKFELVTRKLSFGPLFFSWRARLYCSLIGVNSYERYHAWRFPARNIKLDLRVVKK